MTENKNMQSILNWLIFALPLCFVIGNLFINLNILLFSILGVVKYQTKLFEFKKNDLIILVILFFGFLILSTLLEYIGDLNKQNNIIKSLLYLRYLLFLIVLRFMILKNEFDFKKNLFSCLVFSGFIAFDVIYQFLFGKNLVGFESTQFHNSGFFGDEYMAGGYILKFAILGLFCLPFLFKSDNYKFFSLIFAVAFFFTAILLSGNRMPVLLFIAFCLLALIFFSYKKFQIITLVSSILILVIFALSITQIDRFKTRYLSLKGDIPSIPKIVAELKRSYPELEKNKFSKKPFHESKEWKDEFGSEPRSDAWKDKDKYDIYPVLTGYTQLYITGIDLFLDSPVLGRGIKSFRDTCWEKYYLPNRMCQWHPHHYYLEILNDTGLIGFSILMFGVIALLIRSYKKFGGDFYFLAIFFSILIEFFPFRSSGSFFSTGNSAFVFFLLGILLGLDGLKKKKLISF
tara:strand:+ start:1072 stop:2448 length:1377 start_codon:yes stop_codon:yes gene_type:complete